MDDERMADGAALAATNEEVESFVTTPATTLSVPRLRRLRQYFRSTGWPVRDVVELDLLAAGHIEIRFAPSGHESIYVTAAGHAVLAEQLERNRRKLDAHQALSERVASHLRHQGRMAFTRTSFRVKPGETWKVVRPDVFSIRKSIDERYTAPIVHEIKVSRADLKGDLRNAEKRLGYLGVCARLYYVFPAGVASADDVPVECGVLIAEGDHLVEARPAPVQPNPLRPMHWLHLVASLAGAELEDEQQLSL